MNELIIWTYDWVPKGPRGFVRDLRLRWACEEAGLPYAVRTVAFDGRETNHLEQQPFGQVPFLSDGDLDMFESGAGLMHLARKSEKLMPRDPAGEAATLRMDVRRPQFDRDGQRALVVPRPSPDRRTMPSPAGWATASTSSRRFWASGNGWRPIASPAADLLMVDVLRVGKVRAFSERPEDRSLCDPRHRPPRLQEGPHRPDGAFRSGRRKESIAASIEA